MKKLLLFLSFLLVVSPCFSGTITLDDALIARDSDARVHAYLSAEADTTVTTGGTFVPILGTFTNSPAVKFSLDVDKLQYDGTATQEFEIDWAASISSEDAGRTVHIGISKNETVLATSDASVNGIFLKYADEPLPMSGTLVLSLATDDNVQLQVTSDTNLDVITFYHFITTIRPFTSVETD